MMFIHQEVLLVFVNELGSAAFKVFWFDDAGPTYTMETAT